MYAALKHGNLLKSIYLGCGAFIGALMIYFQFSERAEIGGEKFNLSISEPLFSILVIASIPWIGDIIKGWKK